MTSKIQQLLECRHDDVINYDEIIKKYAWIIKNGNDCILSPDSDGLLCGLLMSQYLNWKIVGFYDGKVMILKKGKKTKNCVFLDMEIFRDDVRSIGHHMLLYNKKQKPQNWDKFKNCIQPNNLRDYDIQHDFRLKYPLATIHMLLGILGHKLKIKVPDTAIPPLLFTDGVFNILFKYPENVLNWLKYLRVNEATSPLKNIFENNISVYSLMLSMDKFFRERDNISIPGQRGDRLRISESDGSPFNLISQNGSYKLEEQAVCRIKKFIKILSEYTKWNFNESYWSWDNFELYRFVKKSFEGDSIRINNNTFNAFIGKDPLSWAATSGQNIEYTLEGQDRLP